MILHGVSFAIKGEAFIHCTDGWHPETWGGYLCFGTFAVGGGFWFLRAGKKKDDKDDE